MQDQVIQFAQKGDPNPQQTLTLAIRGLRIGQRLEMSDGTVVRSVGVKKGAGLERRFLVEPKGTKVLDRHRGLKLGKGLLPTATAAAMQALGKSTRGS